MCCPHLGVALSVTFSVSSECTRAFIHWAFWSGSQSFFQLNSCTTKSSSFGATRARWNVSNPAMKHSFDAARVASSIALESVSVASPCHADWDAMRGDERARFCPSCAKNVYNLSAMTTVEAQSLIAEKEGHLCIRFFQREDGTMLTADCPVGAAAWKEKSPAFALWASVMSLLVLFVAATTPALLPSASAQPETKTQETPLSTATPTSTTTPSATATPTPISTPDLIATMGDFAGPIPPPLATMGKIAPPPTATPTPVPPPSVFLGAMTLPKPPAKFTKSKRKAGSTHRSDLESGFALRSGASKSKKKSR